MIPTRYCNQCGEEDHGSVGCHAQWFQEVGKQIRELEREATKSFEIERVGPGSRGRPALREDDQVGAE